MKKLKQLATKQICRLKPQKRKGTQLGKRLEKPKSKP